VNRRYGISIEYLSRSVGITAIHLQILLTAAGVDCVLHSNSYVIYLFYYLILKSYPNYKIDRDIADNADKTEKKHTGHM